MNQDISVEEFKSALETVTQFCEDHYMGSGSYTQMLINAPLHHAFCVGNKKGISEETVVLMALQILNKLYNTPYWYLVDDWIDKFKEVSLQYLLDTAKK